jgi:multidrug resistance protein
MAQSNSHVSTLTDEKTLNIEHQSSRTTSRRSLSEKSLQDIEQNPDPHGIPIIDLTEDADETTPETSTTPRDPNIVDWDSKDDPARAINWPEGKKWANIAVISAVTFLTPLASSMVAPGVPEIMKEFKSTDETIASFIVSIYILGYAIGPLFLAPLSEVYGRLPVYHSCNILFVIWTIACAVAPNIGSLLFFRLMEGIAGSCPITIGGGSIADLFIQERRGGAMAIFALGPLLGPVIGPVAGGFLAQAAGWRWVFWVLTIAVSHPIGEFRSKTEMLSRVAFAVQAQ